jgi:hypothetical protein
MVLENKNPYLVDQDDDLFLKYEQEFQNLTNIVEGSIKGMPVSTSKQQSLNSTMLTKNKINVDPNLEEIAEISQES